MKIKVLGLVMLSALALGSCGISVSHNLSPKSDVPLYDTEAEAHSACPGEPLVWVNTDILVYHSKGDPFYGAAPRHGAWACRSDADRSTRLRHGYGLTD